MKTKIIEVTNEHFNWGKFLLGRPHEEWQRTVQVGGDPTAGRSLLLARCGWTRDHIWVLDLQTGEGAFFKPGGAAKADLEKHRIWVCPMFEPFLEWLYEQDLSDLDALPDALNFSREEAPEAFAGYRRQGPE